MGDLGSVNFFRAAIGATCFAATFFNGVLFLTVLLSFGSVFWRRLVVEKLNSLGMVNGLVDLVGITSGPTLSFVGIATLPTLLFL